MTFRRRLFPWRIESSDGFSVTSIDRLRIGYRDAEGSATVGVEPMATGDLVVFSDQVTITGTSVPVDEIIDRVVQALRWEGGTVEVS